MNNYIKYITFIGMIFISIGLFANTAPVTVNTVDSNGDPIAAKFKVWKGPNYVGEFNTNSSTQLDVGSTYKLFAHYNGTSTERKTFVVDANGNTFTFKTTNVSAPDFTGGYHDYKTSGSWKKFTLSGTEMFPKDFYGNTMKFRFATGPWNNKNWAVFESDYSGKTTHVLVLKFVTAKVWDDRDGDGKQDGNEPGIEGAIVELLKKNNSFYGSKTTDANGEAQILTHLDQGKLKFYKKTADYAFTLQNKGDDNKDSDAHRSSGKTNVFNINGDVSNQDCGQWSPGSVETYVWDDRDGDGMQDGNEPGIEGVTVRLMKGNIVLNTGVTGPNGIATISGVPADQDCKLDYDLKDSDHAFTLQNKGDDNKDSDAHRSSGRTAKFKTSKGAEVVTKMDCGQWSPGSVETFVWDDRDGDGKQDGNEPGIEGVTVRLMKGNTVLNTGVTGPNGIATISGVPADQDCKLDYDLKDSDHAFTLQNKGDDNKDSDAHRSSGRTAKFKTSKGAEVVTKMDCGQWSPGSVETYVWDDRDGDGKQDGNEPGIEGVTVRLMKGNTVLNTGVTGPNGIATISGVPADQDCKLDYDLKDANHAFTLTNKGDDNKDSDAHRSSGRTAKFKTSKGAEVVTKMDCGQWSPGSVETFVWDDRDGDGKQDGNEPGIEGVTVRLMRGNTVLNTGVTGPNGIATISGVPANQNCKLDFDLKDSDHAFTLQNKGDDNKDSDAHRSNGRTASFKTSKGAEVVTKMDCGQWSPGIVEAYVWYDADNDGKQDGNEFGLGYIKVELQYPNGNVINTGLTNAYGIVRLTGVPADRDVRLKFFKPSVAYTRTLQNKGDDNKDSDAHVNNGRTAKFKTSKGAHLITSFDAGYDVDLDADTDNDGIPDFLDKYPIDNTNNGMGAIAAKAWDDRDGDGKQDGNEPHIGNVDVELRKSNNSKQGKNFTHPYNGLVTFFDIPNGEGRKLEFIKPNKHAITLQNVGQEYQDSDIGTNGYTATFNVTGVVNNQDGGFWSPSTVHAKVWDDLDGDGKQDSNEPGIAGAKVILRKSNNNKEDEALTDNNGIATFTNVDADIEHRLEFERPNKHARTPEGVGQEHQDSDADESNGRTETFKADRGNDLINHIDGGFWSPSIVEAKVWDDLNGNGKQDSNEPGIAGAKVILRKTNNNKEDEALTDNNGIATFTNVDASIEHKLEFERPNKHARAPEGVGQEHQDSDADESNGKSEAFKADRGKDLINHIDGGFFSPSVVEAKVWDDRDGDGKQDSNEPGIAGAKVILRKTNNAKEAEVLTDNNGVATFTNVDANIEHILEFVKPSGHAYTEEGNGQEHQDSDADESNGKSETFKADRGNDLINHIDGGLWAPGTVNSFVWDDRDGDGKQDSNEPGIAGATVQLRKASNGSKVDETQTNANGIATFNNVSADEAFYLEFIRPSKHARAPEGNGQEHEDSDADENTGKSENFEADRGSDQITHIDGGFFSPGSIESYVWDDADGDGKQDASENGVQGVTVQLRRASNGSKLDEKVTDVDGNVTFSNVTAYEDVYLEYIEPNGYSFTDEDKGPEHQDSDANIITGKTSDFTFNKGNETITTYDAGLIWNVAIKRVNDDRLEVSLTPEVYPNPSNGVFTIENISNFRTLSIIDMTGKVIYQVQLDELSETTINLQNPVTGAYMIRLDGNGQTASTPIFIR